MYVRYEQGGGEFTWRAAFFVCTQATRPYLATVAIGFELLATILLEAAPESLLHFIMRHCSRAAAAG